MKLLSVNKEATKASRIVGGNSLYGRVKSDFYPTPREVTLALLEAVNIPKTEKVWEPACGDGSMSRVFENEGYEVISTDLEYQGYGRGGVDFLSCPLSFPFDWVITNPPFSLAQEFILRCESFGVSYALLLKAHFWNAKKRYPLFHATEPTLILPLTWRPDFLRGQRGGGSPLLDCMWCVWEKPPTGNTLFRPILKPV